METRLYGNFKSTNARRLIKPILESSYKVLLGPVLFLNRKQPVYFYGPLIFLAIFKFQKGFNFGNILSKVAKQPFLESPRKSLQMCEVSFTYGNPVGNSGSLK